MKLDDGDCPVSMEPTEFLSVIVASFHWMKDDPSDAGSQREQQAADIFQSLLIPFTE
ncbi:hypothetical protein [Mycolicibacterium agri]|uniref:hypothetical protein n=1 Tax=Mycolicibacterium agri TaxID=36811 RepID=UPI0013D554B3|nr:hypothetical protein [Mycolicibacterium agri]